jgi:hypothetical protein
MDRRNNPYAPGAGLPGAPRAAAVPLIRVSKALPSFGSQRAHFGGLEQRGTVLYLLLQLFPQRER